MASGCFRSQTMASVLTLSTRSRSLESLSACTVQPSTPAPGLVWRYARGLWNMQEAASGLSLSSEKDPPSSLRSRTESSLGTNRDDSACVVIVEDNPADVMLVREAFREHGLDCEILVLTDGESA